MIDYSPLRGYIPPVLEKNAGEGQGSHELNLNLNSVSRKHARIFLRKEEYHIEDLHSTNGTYVNGVRVVKCIL